MLNDIYILAQKRKNAHMPESYKRYLHFSLSICTTNHLIPPHICDAFIEEMTASSPPCGFRQLSSAEISLYQSETPQEQDAYKRVLAAAYKELYEILKLIDEADYCKISAQFITKMRTQMDIYHPFVYDETKDLKQQELLQLTRILLSDLYKQYWSNSSG